MSKLVNVSIDVTKIDKSRLFEGKKGTYLDCDIWINDEADDYGNTVSVNMRQTKEERENKERKIYIGNGKKVFGWDDEPAPAPKPAPAAAPADNNDDVPF